MVDDVKWENERPKRSFIARVMPLLIAVLALGGFVGVVWYAYQQGSAGDYEEVVPMVRAEYESFKSKPENPGGMEIPHQDKYVLNDEPVEPIETEQVFSANPELPEEIMSQDEAGQMADTAGAEMEQSVEQVAEVQAETQLNPAVEAPAQPEPAVAPVQVEEFNVPTAPVAGVSGEVKASEEPAAAPPATAGSTDAIYRVQLISLKSQESAEEAKEAFTKNNPDLFTGLEFKVVRVDLGERGVYYRVQAGNYMSRQEAQQLCDSYKAKGNTCLVVKEEKTGLM